MTIAGIKYEDAPNIEVAKTLLNRVVLPYMRDCVAIDSALRNMRRIQQYMQMTNSVSVLECFELELMLLSNEFQQIEEQYIQAKTATKHSYYHGESGKIPEHWSSDIIKIHPLQIYTD